MRRAAVLLLGLLALAGAAPAPAEERPSLIPTREALVEYRVQGKPGSQPRLVRVRFSAGRMRADPAGLPGYLVVDREADRVMVVMEQQHLYFEVPARSGIAADYLPSDRMRYARQGTDRVAGLSCTIWSVQGSEGRGATACVTADGLVLRGEGHDPRYGEGSIEAVSVAFEPQPARAFAPPDGYQRIAMPALAGAAR